MSRESTGDWAIIGVVPDPHHVSGTWTIPLTMQLAQRSSESRSKIPTAVPFAQFNLTKHTPASAPARSRAAALARAVGRPWEVGRPRGHLPVVVAPGRASPRLAVPGRRRACRRGSRVAADSEVCTIDRHGDPPVGRGASAPLCRDGTILAHGRSPWGPNPE